MKRAARVARTGDDFRVCLKRISHVPRASKFFTSLATTHVDASTTSAVAGGVVALSRTTPTKEKSHDAQGI
jgi:hypothetical protein